MGVKEGGDRFATASVPCLGQGFPQDEHGSGIAGIVSILSASPIKETCGAGNVTPAD